MMILGAHGVRQAEEIAGAGSKTLSRRRDVELLSSGTERLGLTKALVVSDSVRLAGVPEGDVRHGVKLRRTQ
jgi:hypothetical protein